ncbi:MAG TPA: kelch repeat-containing protein [Candidatus Dormibacteraeota bacterium]
MAQMATRVCEAHGVETRLQCVNCGAPICLRCQVRTEVGLKCPKCAAVPEAAQRRRSRAGLVAGLGAAVVFIALLGVILALRLGSGSRSSVPPVGTTTGSWAAQPNLPDVRGSTTAVRLTDGRVLVVGGGVGIVPLAGTDIFNPATNTWASAGQLHQARRGNETVLLQNGRVLTAGGVAGNTVLASTEIWDPAKSTWSVAAPMHTARFNEILIVLPDGKVLAAGGVDSSEGATLSSAEIYNPAADTWTPLPQGLLQSRADAGSAMLAGGRVLIAGGYSQQSGGNPNPLSEVEVFDSAANVFARGPAMTESRSDLTLTALSNGQVLAAGGYSASATLNSAELYDPSTSTWSEVAGMHQERERASASLLRDGSVLVSGGDSADVNNGAIGSHQSLSTAEVYKPASHQWAETPAMHCPRSSQAQVTLTSGNALVVGGDGASPGQPPSPQSCADLFTP